MCLTNDVIVHSLDRVTNGPDLWAACYAHAPTIRDIKRENSIVCVSPSTNNSLDTVLSILITLAF